MTPPLPAPAPDPRMPRTGRPVDVDLASTECLDSMTPWSWPVMKTLEGVFITACSPLAAALFDRFHASEAAFAYTSAEDGGSWLQVHHTGPAAARAIAAYAEQLCVDPQAAQSRAVSALSVKIEPRQGMITVHMAGEPTPPPGESDASAALVECFYRTFVLRHLAYLRGTLPPPGQGIVLTYGRDRMRIEHVHAPASGPTAQCLWIDEVPASQRISLD